MKLVRRNANQETNSEKKAQWALRLMTSEKWSNPLRSEREDRGTRPTGFPMTTPH